MQIYDVDSTSQVDHVLGVTAAKLCIQSVAYVKTLFNRAWVEAGQCSNTICNEFETIQINLHCTCTAQGLDPLSCICTVIQQ